MLRLSRTRRGRRSLVALLGGIIPLVLAALPVHANFESIYVLPWQVCAGGTCTAETTVHLLVPADYAACVAMLTAAELTPNTPVSVRGTPPGSADVDTCDTLSSEDAWLTVWVHWTPGGCVSNGSTQALENGRFPVWSTSVGGSTTGQTCSTIDSGYTQAFSLFDCPSTTFQVTADIKGNADGTFQGSYSVNGSGTCATAFDVLVVEGAPEQGLGSVIGCKIFCPGPPVLDTGAAATRPAPTAPVRGAGRLPATAVQRQPTLADGLVSTALLTCRRTAPCPS